MAYPKIMPVSPSATRPAFGPWTCCARPAGSIAHPDQLAGVQDWLAASVPGTAAAALEAAGQWSLGQEHNFDADDWWFRTAFPFRGASCQLRFDGLATLAEVWLNGQQLLVTDNMFRSFTIDVGPHLREDNELFLGFRSLEEDLKKKRPRPRWKTNLVKHQQLRWRRTSLLGRIPGWSPPVAPTGPWRAVHLDTLPIDITDWRLTSRVIEDRGIVFLHGKMRSSAPIQAAQLRVGDHQVDARIASCAADGNTWSIDAELRLDQPPLWWPHTQGPQSLLPCAVHLTTTEAQYVIDCRKIGFRKLEVRQDPTFTVLVNNVPIFCRGACWTVSDMVRLDREESLEQDLRLARDAGVNMLRVGGTMTYESDRFYELCDELGIMVWQDFMFANMDYPDEDDDFAANIEAEARQQLARLAPHPSLAVLCGNSEVEQQAAMLGMPREIWRNCWFADDLPKLCAEYAPDAGYVPSTPSGFVMPFHVGDGVAHYYGVGAYLRLPAELRQADVKFTSECLGFSNIPEPETTMHLTGTVWPAPHDPRWKQRVPRDIGAGWDFEDVRDFYLQHLFAVDPVALRSFDLPRYVQLSRVVPGEMMTQVFAEWRGHYSHCLGGLVWFFKDLWPGAGWGIIDSFGLPKATYFYLKRCWQPRQITITNEGLDGLHIHAINETAVPFHGFIELTLLRDGHIVVARKETACILVAKLRQMWIADALLGGFHDVTYAYRFGPQGHDLAIATLFDERRSVISEAFFFVTPRNPAFLSGEKLETEVVQVGDGYEVRLQCDRFLQGVRFDAPGFLPDDSYFHLAPAQAKIVTFRPERAMTRFRASLEALNLRSPVMLASRGP